MTTYAIAHLTDVTMGPDNVRYLEGIDATLALYHGRFIIHGDQPEVLEGTWSGDLVMIECPGRASVRASYASDAYQVNAATPSTRAATIDSSNAPRSVFIAVLPVRLLSQPHEAWGS
ncbi:DUF1330 domain-containing protein [Bosea sp. Root381]|uniref:DUF1330 domain-containing protein n=1 Tax=Bosea sp. Root381 TaxID=1736524 RepID=UPI0009EC9EC0|nr:DUF1330 domain-containing protein [Bosea sp. Root381]